MEEQPWAGIEYQVNYIVGLRSCWVPGTRLGQGWVHNGSGFLVSISPAFQEVKW